jgi:hypothetical protein
VLSTVRLRDLEPALRARLRLALRGEPALGWRRQILRLRKRA